MSDASIWDSGVAGPPGPPGARVLFRLSATHIQMAYEGELIWTNLVPLSEITGPQGESIVGPQGPQGEPGQSIVGPKGDKGDPGADGADGVPVPTLFAEKQITANTTALAKVAAVDSTLNTATDYTLVAGIWNDGLSNGITQVANGFEVVKEGNYFVHFWCTARVSTNNTDLAFRVAVNGAFITGRKLWGRLDATTDRENFSGFALPYLYPGDVVTVWVATSTTTDLTISEGVLAVNEILSTQVTVEASESIGDPVGMPKFWPMRSAIPAGYAALDGQELSQAAFPDFYDALLNNVLPTIDEATWQADPTQRGKFVINSSAGKFRLADYNGKFAGSLGAVTLRGDGALSAAISGVIQRGAMQGHKHRTPGYGGNTLPAPSWASLDGVEEVLRETATYNSTTSGYRVLTGGAAFSDGVNGTPLVASETRMLNVTGCMIIKLFGTVTNPGSADAAQLASDFANLASRVTALENAADGYYTTTVTWANGGTILVTHNLGVVPKFVIFKVVAKVAIGGLAVGEEEQVVVQGFGSANIYNPSARKFTTTQVTVQIGALGLAISNGGSATGVSPAQADLKIEVIA